MNDMECTAPCLAAKKLDWNTSGRKQADFNSQDAALGVNGKILSAGWYHKWADNNWAADGNFYLVISIQGIYSKFFHGCSETFERNIQGCQTYRTHCL